MSAKKTNRILILGGYGNAGRLIAELLLREEKSIQLIIAGRNLAKAERLANELNGKFNTTQASACVVDATDSQRLQAALDGVDLVVVAASTSQFVKEVATAAIDTGSDYLDIQLSLNTKLDALRSLQSKIEKAGCCFITDGGFHPGVPAALVRYAASFFDRMDRANVFSFMRINWSAYSFSDATLMEMMTEFRHYRPIFFRQGKWHEGGWSSYRLVDFGQPWGKKYCAPMMMEEMRSLPELLPSLQETGFFVSGFNWFTDYVLMLPLMLGLKIFPRHSLKPAAKLFFASLKAFSKPPFITILLMNAYGLKNGALLGRQITLWHEDPYRLTAIPAVACLRQYLHGPIRQPGLWFQGTVVAPDQFIADLKQLGLHFKVAGLNES
ncbi:MAG: saccharopine dehydrogenase NADP-binding domain-containing protein [candidate division KSB1 bacterium]|nr:saccharopine dehydrogenase NADP-binding domain-containing protein [candidate division KSB1 bacterium]MDZ7318324.1 saccharopine dehydrogenase NADP-binding domain-containing protein [candidate division KSB1 bacterium]